MYTYCRVSQAVNDYVIRNRVFSGGEIQNAHPAHYDIYNVCSICTVDISLNIKPEYLPHLSSVIILNHDLRLLDSIGRGETVCVHHDQ